MSDVSELTGATDAALAARLAAGDGAAQAELFRRLGPRIRLYGLRHLRDPAAADDLVQDVILTTFDGVRDGRLRDPECLASYVLGTCRKVVANLRRGAQRRQQILARHGRELAPLPADQPPCIDLDSLTRCLGALAERERSVVVLSFYVEHGADEIGAELGLTPGNVRVVRHRALARLRACLEACA